MSFWRSPDVPQWVIADEGKLRQILINLINNAVKFTHEGDITVRTKVKHQASEEELTLLIEVQDSGPGIEPEERIKLFQSFEQTQAGRRSGTGTGLGLAITREYVRLMGGDITVSSQPGRGSIFVVQVLLKETVVPEISLKEKANVAVGLRPGQPEYRILIADDIVSNRKLLARMLENIGFQTRPAIHGLEAVRLAAEWNPNLILMDMQMPVMDGYEAIRKIRSGDQGREVAIIAVTASALEENRREILAIGANDY